MPQAGGVWFGIAKAAGTEDSPSADINVGLDHRTLEKSGAGAQLRAGADLNPLPDVGLGPNHAGVLNIRVSFDYRKRPNEHPGAERRTRVNHGAWVDLHRNDR
jgi:hypothetical protein